MEMLRLMSNVFGGSSRYLSMLASKADECLHVGIRGSLENGEVNLNGTGIIENGMDILNVNGAAAGGRVVELLDEEDPQSGTASTLAMSSYDGFDALDGEDPTTMSMFDFGALSEASMAWLGSMADDTFAGYEEVPQDMAFQTV